MTNIPMKISTDIEAVVIGGDLSKLNPEQRMSYCKAICDSVGLNFLTRPLDYITLNGKLTLYANKGCAEQLRAIHNISINITSRQLLGDVYVVTAKAKNAAGREDESTGAVPVAGLKGEALANAYLKCETKAKRRVTLSICGLNMLDETEVESIRQADNTYNTSAPQNVVEPHLPQIPQNTPTTQQPPKYNRAPGDELRAATENQRKMLWARIKNDLKMSDQEGTDFIKATTGKEHKKDLNWGDVDKLVHAIENEKNRPKTEGDKLQSEYEQYETEHPLK